MERAENITWSTATILAMISIFTILVGDRIVVAIQIENARTRIMALEQTQQQQDSYIKMIRDRQVVNEERITRLEDRVK